MLFFDLTVQYIFAFFLMIYLANYINFLGYNVLIRRIKTQEGPMLKQRTNIYFYVMNGLYVANLLLAVTDWYGPWCNQDWLYPLCLHSAALLYVANFVYHLYLNKNDYFLKWENFDSLT